MDIAALRRFYLLSRNNTITRAAEEAFMSRQAFTDSIARLEAEMGIKLYVRDNRRIVLTEAGRELSRYLQERLPEWDAELGRLKVLASREEKCLHIGSCFSDLDKHYYDRMMSFGVENGFEIEYNDYTIDECFAMLADGRLDAVFSLGVEENETFDRIRIPESGTETMIILHNSHPLASRKELCVADLDGCSFIVQSYDSKPSTYLDYYLRPFHSEKIYVPARNAEYWLTVLKTRGAVGLASNRKPGKYADEGFVRIPLLDYPIDMSCYLYFRKSPPMDTRRFIRYIMK